MNTKRPGGAYKTNDGGGRVFVPFRAISLCCILEYCVALV